MIVSSCSGKENIDSDYVLTNWQFGSSVKRSYSKASDLKFKARNRLQAPGGIQLLLSPDIFNVSEMKMYNYYGRRESSGVFCRVGPLYAGVAVLRRPEPRRRVRCCLCRI